MRTSTAIIGAGCALGVFSVMGCHHAGHHRGRPVVSDPVGMMVVQDHPSGKTGVYEALDGEAKPTINPPPAGRPATLPDKVTAKPLPAEQIATPVIKTGPAPMIPAILPSPPALTATPVVTAPPANGVTGIIAPAVKPAPIAAPVVEPAPQQVTDFTKGTLPAFAANPKAGHAADFGWVVGELAYSHSKKEWRLRYAGLDADDKFGGSVTLTGVGDFEGVMESGKLVHVEGEVLDKDSKAAPRFRVTALKPVAQ